jgi:hypothetical protein
MRTRVRGWRWRRNPLRRRCDVIEAWTALAVAVLLFLGAPLAGAAMGWWAYDDARATAAAQRAERHRVPAVLVENAPAAVPTAQGGKQPTYKVKVRWHEPGRGTRTGETQVSAGLRRGDRAHVWLDSRGRNVAPPTSSIAIWQQTVATGVWTASGIVALVLVVRVGARRVAERHRMAEWADEWARTGPEWRRHTA